MKTYVRQKRLRMCDHVLRKEGNRQYYDNYACAGKEERESERPNKRCIDNIREDKKGHKMTRGMSIGVRANIHLGGGQTDFARMDSVGGGVVAEIFRDPYSVGVGGGSGRNVSVNCSNIP